MWVYVCWLTCVCACAYAYVWLYVCVCVCVCVCVKFMFLSFFRIVLCDNYPNIDTCLTISYGVI